MKSRALEYGERGVAFIEVAHFRLEAECGEQAPAADAEHQLLHETQVGITAIQGTRDAAVRREVRCIIAVEQIEPRASDLNLPGPQPDRVARHIEPQPQPLPVRLP
jgi:hypothetical protein